VACHTDAHYGENPRYIPKDHVKGTKLEHISSIDSCYDTDIKELDLVPGQLWSVNGVYNYTDHPANKMGHGHAADIMAIAMLFVKVNATGVPMPKV
jgi:hypothetical protein